jgi:hypothetical protein
VELTPTSAPAERWAFKGVAWSPAQGGRAIIRHREPRAAAASRPLALAG